ncbi:MAG TPA: DUF2333 domain-containing protein [Desulfobacter sp.]|uniref:DUF2333 family protein n=1 Tax=Desulfobacter sp. UBA2225 TaxID=1961413 RepID=UPI000E8EDADC|nr:DUF2333 family protein [Desulfobacter sp. UBA2225]HAR32942.1 DUF2333 domain-containing protein [Desulfobacter sp.]
MEEAKNADNGGDAVKKKSFLKKILLTKWFVITVLILGVSGYAAWWGWGMNWWTDFSAKIGGQTHGTQVAQKINADHDTDSTAKDTTHGTQTTHQPALQKQDSHVTAQHTPEPQNHTTPQTTFNKTADEHKTVTHAPLTPAAENVTAHAAPVVRTAPHGVAFVDACIRPLDYELNHRFWGWRPNDIIRFTDNINKLQLGILEVTRRTAVALAENLSRTGSTDAYIPSLEYAMNSFMIKSTEYMFPSAENKYQEGLNEWRNYQKMLEKGEANFYRRIDNLVPLLKAYESILGSCDENLVKDLGKISTFKADDVFYYTKGVATAMATILEAVAVDFHDTISDQGTDLIHHAVEALHHASHLDPWIVLEGSPDGVLANHRANLAAYISHARFYLDVLSRSLTGNL